MTCKGEAETTRLDRVVAIKVLSPQLADDPQFRDRFDREAKAISALDHPHICALYDVGQQAGTAYLVMQYLEGETLERRLNKGALPLDQALQYAMQIADALDKAHRAGIVHRDLKPGNIMLTKSGARLLDFGLAKATAPVGAAAGLSMLPTTPANVTAQGTILGTFQYMAPEQLEGRETDARTDIFAFGAVVYEMLTSKRAFEGKSQASLISAIMSADPTPIAASQPLTPPLLDHIVTRCLAKDPDDRWQSARDLLRELQWMADAGSQVGMPVATGQARSTSEVARVVRRERLVWGSALACVALVASLMTRWALRPGPPPPEMRVEITTPSTPAPLEFALAPDGRSLVFVASGDGPQRLWWRALDRADAQPMAGTEGADYPFWSPDSRSIGFTAAGKLKRIDLAGGPPQTLASTSVSRGGAWNGNGTILFSAVLGPLSRIAASGAEPAAATRLVQAAQHVFPQFLPDGRHFLYYAIGTPEVSGVYLGSLDGGDPKRLAAADSAGAYFAPSTVAFLRQTTLIAQHLDVERGKLTGDPVRLVDPVGSTGLGFGGFSVSEGQLAYRGTGGGLRQLTWYDRTGRALGVAGEPDAATLLYPELSPDGRHVAFQRTVLTNFDIWLMDLVRGGETRFTFDPAIDTSPLWSPDGMRIAFGSTRIRTSRSLPEGVERRRRRRIAAANSDQQVAAGLVEGWPVPVVFGHRPENRTRLMGFAHERSGPRSDTDQGRRHAVRGTQRAVLS